MENIALGQRRWTILRTTRFWLKITQMVCAVVAIVLCTMFNQNARVHMIHSHYYYSISLTFPFIYESNVTVQYSLDLPLRQFKFEKLLLPSVLTFVVATALALIVATVVLILDVVHHGLQESQTYIKVSFFISLGMTFMVLAGICLWLANLITLVQDVNDEVSFLLNQCKENNGTCETKEPNFITLYISMVFGILLFLLWLIECIQIFIKMVYTIPAQITLTTLVRNVELNTVVAIT